MTMSPCLTRATRVLCILKERILTCFLPSTRAMQIMHISLSSRDASLSVYIFPRKREGFWISSRDTSVVAGTSSRRSFGHCILHRAPQALFHLMQRSTSRSMIERLRTSLQAMRQMVARPWDLSCASLQSLDHRQVYATCAESCLMISVIFERQSSLCSWEFAIWIETAVW